MLLIIDNYDSFTYNLYDYLAQIGIASTVIRNDEKTIDEIKGMDFNGILISPGPKKPADAGISPAIIEHFKNSHPILGICLGFQTIGQHFGAELYEMDYPLHGKTSVIKHNSDELFKAIPHRINVMHYHSLALKNIISPIVVLAETENGLPMAIKHKTLPIYGLQFHPESILTESGLDILRNWTSICSILPS